MSTASVPGYRRIRSVNAQPPPEIVSSPTMTPLSSSPTAASNQPRFGEGSYTPRTRSERPESTIPNLRTPRARSVRTTSMIPDSMSICTEWTPGRSLAGSCPLLVFGDYLGKDAFSWSRAQGFGCK